MKQFLLLLLLLLMICAEPIAQTNGFRIGFGYQRTWMVDKQASPLKYQTSEKSILLGYSRVKEQSIFHVQMQGSLGRLSPTGFFNRQFYNPGYNADGTPKRDSGNMNGRMYNGAFSIGYAQKVSSGMSVIGKTTSQSGNYVGASLSNQIFYTSNIIRSGWMNTTSLNADLAHRAVFNVKHNAFVRITIPLVARNTRLPYHNTVGAPNNDAPVKSLFKQGSRFASLGSFQNIRIEAGVDYSVTRNVGIGLQYSGQWLHYTRERAISLFQNNIGVFASIK